MCVLSGALVNCKLQALILSIANLLTYLTYPPYFLLFTTDRGGGRGFGGGGRGGRDGGRGFGGGGRGGRDGGRGRGRGGGR